MFFVLECYYCGRILPYACNRKHALCLLCYMSDIYWEAAEFIWVPPELQDEIMKRYELEAHTLTEEGDLCISMRILDRDDFAQTGYWTLWVESYYSHYHPRLWRDMVAHKITTRTEKQLIRHDELQNTRVFEIQKI